MFRNYTSNPSQVLLVDQSFNGLEKLRENTHAESSNSTVNSKLYLEMLHASSFQHLASTSRAQRHIPFLVQTLLRDAHKMRVIRADGLHHRFTVRSPFAARPAQTHPLSASTNGVGAN